MGLRFQKRIKLLPWVWLNISKSGFSFSFGPSGLSVNIGKKGTKITAGIPGTGVSASHLFSGQPVAGAITRSHDSERPPFDPGLLSPASKEADHLYVDAVSFVMTTRRASISAVQRSLKIGYTRASAMIEQMALDGIVTQPDSQANREIMWDGASPLAPCAPAEPALLKDSGQPLYFFKAHLEVTNTMLAIAMHGRVCPGLPKGKLSSLRGEWLLVADPDRINVTYSDGSPHESYLDGEYAESEIGRLPPGADHFKLFVFLLREIFELPLSVPDKIAKITAKVDELSAGDSDSFQEYIESYQGAPGILNRLLPTVIDLLPVPDEARTSLKNAGYRTLRELDRANDESLLSLRGFNKGILAKAKRFASHSGIPLDSERIEREPEFRGA